eukprot:5253571-Pleurochrysis_carterae.AAC.1
MIRAMNVLPREGKAGERRARAACMTDRSRRKGSKGSRRENASARCIGQTWQRQKSTAAEVGSVSGCVRTAPATILAVPAAW